jgi:hypothetical protein
MKSVDKIFLSVVLVGLWATCYIYFKGFEPYAKGEDVKLIGQGRIFVAFVTIIGVYLTLVNPFWKWLGSPLPLITVLWTGWTLSVSTMLLSQMTLSDWLAVYAAPCLLWPCAYLFFFTLCTRTADTKLISYGFLAIAAYATFRIFQIFFGLTEERVKYTTGLNGSYYVLLSLPWILLIRNVLVRHLEMITTVVVMVVSTKRTSTLALAVAIVVYYLFCVLSGQIKTVSLTRVAIGFASLVVTTAIMATIVSVAHLSVSQRFDRLFDRFEGMAEDQGSERLSLYKEYLEDFSKMPFRELMVGHGYNSGVLYHEYAAHNDWLENTYDFGLVGLLLYNVFHLLLIRRAIQLLRWKSPLAAAYAAGYAIFFIMSMISLLFLNPNYFTILLAFFGAVEGFVVARSPTVLRPV